MTVSDPFFQYQRYILPEITSPSGQLNWGRLVCSWHERLESNTIQTHTYAACIDGKDGGIYLDCRPMKIFIKCLAHLFARPLHAIIKTIYQLSLYPVFKEITKSSPHSNQQKFLNTFKSFADILLTPLCGLILTIATVGVLVIGAIQPNSLYEGRKLLGKIEQVSNRGEIHTYWTLANCFQPHSLNVLDYYGKKDCRNDTDYQSNDLVERQLANFARAHICKKRFIFDFFSCSTLDQHTPYQSPILKKLS